MQPPSIFEVLYGGQRGGGKTDAGMVWVGHRRWIDQQGNEHPAYQHPRYRGLVIRKNADDLSDWIERFRYMYAGTGAKVGYRPYEIRFPSGAFIRTGHLKDEQAYTKYQGHEYQSTLIEELTQIPSEKRYIQLINSCRSTIPELRPQVFNTTNPGNVGHSWVKERWINKAPPNTVFTDEEGINRIFIPAGIEDNPVLMQNDPAYVRRLDAIKHVDEDLYKAWRLGSWDVFAGQAFREFSYDKHVMDGVRNKFEFSLDICDKFITFDWGYRDKAAAHWLALTPPNRFGFRRVYCYREIIRTETDPEAWAQIIKKFTDVEKVKFMVLPHDAFAHKLTKVTIADVFARDIGISIHRGDTLAKGARLNRKAMLHRYLSDAPDGRPYLLIHPSCRDLITTIPELQYDDKNVEDIDTTGDDHCLQYDTMVYTVEGAVKIGDLVGKEGKVYTPNGIQRFHSVRQTGTGRIYRLSFSDGTIVNCTAKHPFLTDRGWVLAIDLRSDDKVHRYDCRNSKRNKASFQWRQLLQNGNILSSYQQKVKRLVVIASQSLGISSRSNFAWLSYSSQGCQSQQQSNRESGDDNQSSAPPGAQQPQSKQSRVAEEKAQTYGSGDATKINSMAQIRGWFEMAQKTLRKYEREITWDRQSYKRLPFAMLALLKTIYRACGACSLVFRKMCQQSPRRQKEVRLVSRTAQGVEKVYNLEVDNEHCFMVQGGIVVHNSYDSVTLGLISLGYAPQNSKILQPRHKVVQTFPTWNTNEYGNVVAPNFWTEVEKRRTIKPQDSEYR